MSAKIVEDYREETYFYFFIIELLINVRIKSVLNIARLAWFFIFDVQESNKIAINFTLTWFYIYLIFIEIKTNQK
jgi:hypothetical protein